jgi:zinc protease
MLGQRLVELSLQPDPPFIAGGSGIGELTPRYESYSSSALLGPRGALPAIDALVQENERARRYGFTAAELERVKKNVMRNFERAYNERDKTESATYVAEYMRNFLEGESLPGMEAEYVMMKELVPAITLDEVNAYARHTIPADAAKLVIYTGAEGEGQAVPQREQLLSAVSAAEKLQVKAHDEKALASTLMDKAPKAGAIVEESEDKVLGITRLTLSNGVKVVLKPTDFKNDQVLMGATRFGGQSLFDDKDIDNVRFATPIVESMGIKDLAPLDASKVLAGKSASLRTVLGGYTDNLSGNAGASDIETMLQMVWLRFNGVRRDEGLYKSFIGKQVELARNQLNQPNVVFNQAILSALYNDHPRAPHIMRPDEYSKLSLDRSIDIYRQRFASAKGMTFFFVGSFDVKAIKPLLAAYLASLPTADLPVEWRDSGLRPASGVIKREVHRGADDKSTVSLHFTGKADFSQAERMKLAVLMEVMNLRIIDVLRQQLGLIYGGSMGGQLSPLPYGQYAITATLPTGPQNVDKVLAATFAEIEKIQRDGPTAADLEKVRIHWMQGYHRSLRENSYWLSVLQASLTEGTDPHAVLDVEQMLAKITTDDVKEAARRYLNKENYVQVVLYPEKTAATTVASAAVTEAGAR